jgi:hypothetical protein
MEYEVAQGDCINSIARENGLLRDTVWNDPKNTALKAKRKDYSILYPGDVVYVPEKRLRVETGVTEQVHLFQTETECCKLRIRLLINDKPRAGEAYQLKIDGKLSEGKTDGDGWIDQMMAPDAKEGQLVLVKTKEQYTLLLGHMDPITEISGIQKRLQNLGFYIGKKADGIMGPKTASGVKAFQRKYGLAVDGIPGPKTQARLKELYRC